MVYKLNITDRADELLDNILSYLLCNLKNLQAAQHLLQGIESIYERLESNPYQFPLSRDAYLSVMEYREAVVPQMKYMIIFEIDDDIVTILGIFHQSENYPTKL